MAQIHQQNELLAGTMEQQHALNFIYNRNLGQPSQTDPACDSIEALRCPSETGFFRDVIYEDLKLEKGDVSVQVKFCATAEGVCAG